MPKHRIKPKTHLLDILNPRVPFKPPRLYEVIQAKNSQKCQKETHDACKVQDFFHDFSGSRLDSDGYKLDANYKVQDFLDAFGYFGIFWDSGPRFLWMHLDTCEFGWIHPNKKEKVHKKNRESPRNFGYKMYPEATPTRSRTYIMDTEKILFIKYLDLSDIIK